MATIVIDTDGLRELARRLRSGIEQLDVLERNVRTRAAGDPALAAHTASLQKTLSLLREVRNVLADDHNQVVREITEIEAAEGHDPGGTFVATGATVDVPPSSQGDSPFRAFVETVSATFGSGIAPRRAWVTEEGDVVPGTETIAVDGFGSAWDEELDRAFRDEMRHPKGSGSTGSPGPERDDDPHGRGGTGGDDPGKGSGGSGTGGPGDDAGAGHRSGAGGAKGPGGERAAEGGSGRGPGGSGDDVGTHDGATGDGAGGETGGTATGAPNRAGTGDGSDPEGSGGPGGEGSEGEPSGGKSGGSGGGGFGGGSIGDFFDAILENPISAVLAALPLLSNPVGWLGAVALVAMYADELLAGISELLDDPEAFVAKVGEFMEDSLGDLMAAAEDFVTDPLSAVGETVTTAVEGAAGEIADYLERLQDDPLGTILDTVAEVAALAGVDVGAVAGEALGALGEIAPELLDTIDDLAEAAGGIAEAVDTVLDTVEVVGDVAAGFEAARDVLTTLGLDELAGVIPSIDDAVGLVPGAGELLGAAGIDPSDLVGDLDLSSLAPELQDAFRSAVGDLPIGDLPEGIRSAFTEAVGDLRLDELDQLPGKLKDQVLGQLQGLAGDELGDLVDRLPSGAREAVEQAFRRAGFDGVDLSDLDLAALDLDRLPHQVTEELARAVAGLPVAELPESVRNGLAEALRKLPVDALDDLGNGRLPDVRTLLAGLPLDELGGLPDQVRTQFGAAVAELAEADPQGFVQRMVDEAASKVPTPPTMPSVVDLLGSTGLHDLVQGLTSIDPAAGLADAIDRIRPVALPDLPDLHGLADLVDGIEHVRPVDLPDLPDLHGLADLVDGIEHVRPVDLPDLPDLPHLPDLLDPVHTIEDAIDDVRSVDLPHPEDRP